MFEAINHKVTSIVDAFQANPVLFSAILAVGLVLITLKWWVIGRGAKSALEQNSAGWRTDASSTQAKHATGLGHRDVLVMKPIGFRKVAFFTLIFFGGGAVFMGLTALQEPNPTAKQWFSVIAGIGFSLIAIWLLIFSFTKISFDEEVIERRALFRRNLCAPWPQLKNVKPVGKTIAGGVVMEFQDGQKLKIIARMSGYRALLDHLARKDPKLRLMVQMVGSRMGAKSGA